VGVACSRPQRCLRAVDRETLYSALEQLADEEDETDAA